MHARLVDELGHLLDVSGQEKKAAPRLCELPELPAVSSIELLEAHNNRLQEIDEAYFAGLPRLRRLVLAGNQLTKLPSSLSACSRMQFLQVGANQIGALQMEPRRCIGFDEAEGGGQLCWPDLETLFLEGNPMRALPPELAQCHKLTRCNLSKTELQDADAVVSAVRKLVLSRPGGSFWSPNGRRWMADDGDARAAQFASTR